MKYIFVQIRDFENVSTFKFHARNSNSGKNSRKIHLSKKNIKLSVILI